MYFTFAINMTFQLTLLRHRLNCTLSLFMSGNTAKFKQNCLDHIFYLNLNIVGQLILSFLWLIHFLKVPMFNVLVDTINLRHIRQYRPTADNLTSYIC